MVANLAEHKENVLKHAKRRLRSRGMQKSLAALDHVNRPDPEPQRSHEFIAITEEAHRGKRTVARGDGSAIEFKDAQYVTNDPAEVALLEKTPGVSVSQFKRYGSRKSFAVPALPWHKESE